MKECVFDAKIINLAKESLFKITIEEQCFSPFIWHVSHSYQDLFVPFGSKWHIIILLACTDSYRLSKKYLVLLENIASTESKSHNIIQHNIFSFICSTALCYTGKVTLAACRYRRTSAKALSCKHTKARLIGLIC